MAIAAVPDPSPPDIEPKRTARRTETEARMLRELADELGLQGPGRIIETKTRLPIARGTDWIERPRTRADCIDGPRPCPFVSCSHHLMLEVDPRSGSLHFPFGELDVDELPETCELDAADRGGMTLAEVGEATNVSRERIRQVEERGLLKLKEHTGGELGLPPDAG